jgi:hypothetical protein
MVVTYMGACYMFRERYRRFTVTAATHFVSDVGIDRSERAVKREPVRVPLCFRYSDPIAATLASQASRVMKGEMKVTDVTNMSREDFISLLKSRVKD